MFRLAKGVAGAGEFAYSVAVKVPAGPAFLMAKPNKNKNRQPAEGQGGGDDAPTDGPARWVRVVLSIVLAWHVFVVFISPLAIDPTSIFVASIARSPYVRWYTDQLYLNHGYHFFGPDPPTNQIVRYQLFDSGGQVVDEGSFPNKEAQRPRLFYHRHMMLADQAANGPPDVPPEDWLRLTLRAYGRELLRDSDAERVTVECVAHTPLNPRQSLEGVDPNGDPTFVSVAWVEETRAALDQPLPVPAAPQREGEAISAEPLPPGGLP